MMRLTELVEILVKRAYELEDPNAPVRIMVSGPEGRRWLNVELIAVDDADESVILYTDPGFAELEVEHWD
jgi:hypothetical protein